MEVNALNCPGCGSAVVTTQTQCLYCGRALQFTTFSDTHGASFEKAKEFLKSIDAHHKVASGQSQPSLASPEVNLAKALVLFDTGLYGECEQILSTIIGAGSGEAEAYFYRALSRLRQYKPAILKRPVAEQIIADLNTAFALESRPQYLWVKAWVIEMAFERKFIKYPEASKTLYTQISDANLCEADYEQLYAIVGKTK